MEKKMKKSLTSTLHDRSKSTKFQFSRQISNGMQIQKLPLFVTMDHYDKLQKKIETLENEAIRHNKVLNMYIERIEELENTVKKLEESNKELQQSNKQLGLMYHPNENLYSVNNQSDIIPQLILHKSDLVTAANITKSTTTTTMTNSNTSISSNNSNNSSSNNRLSIMPFNKDKKRSTPKKLIPLSEANMAQIDPSGSGDSFFKRFTKFFKHRPSVEALKEQNIYHNEPCFDTELENVIKHEEYPTIPKIVVECIKLIEIRAKKKPTEGLYRCSGNHVEIQKIRFLIDDNDYECLNSIKDIHTIIGVLKLFLREIKDPLVNVSEIKAFIGSARDWTLAPVKMKILVLQKLVKSLPEQNRDTLQFFLQHLHKLIRMPLQFVNARSLAVSLTPTIFHFTISNNADIHTTMKENEALTSCLEIMIEHEAKIFETSFGRALFKKKIVRKWPSCPCINLHRMHLKAIEYN